MTTQRKSIGQNFTCCNKINVQLTLTLIIRQRKYYACLIFVIEGDRRKFFDGKNFLSYGTTDLYTCIHVCTHTVLMQF